MKEIKITIPDNCELIKEGDSYVVKEKKNPPRSWEEFCKKYPLQKEEFYISSDSEVHTFGITKTRDSAVNKNYCVSKAEAEAFLALMQLRQLRKAWVGDWEQSEKQETIGVILCNRYSDTIEVNGGDYWCNVPLSFPTKEMAKDFFSCFKNLCETAKILL